MLIKKIIKKFLLLFGYKISRIESSTSHYENSPETNFKNLDIRGYSEVFNTLEDNSLNPYPVSYDHFEALVKGYEYLFNLSFNTSLSQDPTRTLLLLRMFGTPTPEAYFLISSLIETEGIQGDVCEFGITQGSTSALIAHEIKDTTKKCIYLTHFKASQNLVKKTNSLMICSD